MGQKWDQNETKMRPNWDQNETRMWPECDQNVTRIWPKCDQNVTRMWPECDQNVTKNLAKMWPKQSQNLAKFTQMILSLMDVITYHKWGQGPQFPATNFHNSCSSRHIFPSCFQGGKVDAISSSLLVFTIESWQGKWSPFFLIRAALHLHHSAADASEPALASKRVTAEPFFQSADAVFPPKTCVRLLSLRNENCFVKS